MDDSDRKFDNPQCGRVYSTEGLSPTINTCQGGQREPKILLDMEKENNANANQDPTFLRAACGFGKPAEQDIPSAVTSSAYADNNFVKEPKIVGYTRDSKGNITNHHLQEHANTIHTCTGSGRNTDQYVAEAEPKTRYRIRKLTEREVFRLQDVDDEDITKIQNAGISKTAQYRLAGNSIVVNVLYHIFRKLFVQTECETQQLSLF